MWYDVKTTRFLLLEDICAARTQSIPYWHELLALSPGEPAYLAEIDRLRGEMHAAARRALDLGEPVAYVCEALGPGYRASNVARLIASTGHAA